MQFLIIIPLAVILIPILALLCPDKTSQMKYPSLEKSDRLKFAQFLAVLPFITILFPILFFSSTNIFSYFIENPSLDFLFLFAFSSVIGPLVGALLGLIAYLLTRKTIHYKTCTLALIGMSINILGLITILIVANMLKNHHASTF